MEKIAIITDSSADIDQEKIKKHNIHYINFRIIYSDKEYEDKADISPDEVYRSLSTEIPTTSLPSIEKIEALFNRLEQENYTHVISINISSNLSGTLNSVRLVAQEHPKLTTFVFDTKTLTGCQGNIALEAAKMVEDGATFDEIVKALPEFRKKSHCFFTISTLKYLKKGGRIGRVAGTIGELLDLKPIIEVADDGIYNTYAKVRGRKQSLNKLHEILDGFLAKGKCKVAILQGLSEEDCKNFLESLKGNENITELETGPISPALGVHTGPGLIGLIIQEV